MILYHKKSQILLRSQTKNSQANDLQKRPDFYNLAIKKPIWQPCRRAGGLCITLVHNLVSIKASCTIPYMPLRCRDCNVVSYTQCWSPYTQQRWMSDQQILSWSATHRTRNVLVLHSLLVSLHSAKWMSDQQMISWSAIWTRTVLVLHSVLVSLHSAKVDEWSADDLMVGHTQNTNYTRPTLSIAYQ